MMEERQTYILWVDEGRMHEGARKIMQMIMKTEAMEPKGEECSREVETDCQNSQIRNSEDCQEEEAYLRAGIFITVLIFEKKHLHSLSTLFPNSYMHSITHITIFFPGKNLGH